VVVSGVWDLNYLGTSANAVTRAILGGWSTSYIFTAQSGQPYSATIGFFDLNNDGNTRNDRVPGLGRNTFQLPTTWSLDPRISREVSLHERAKLQLIVEAFNVFNRLNLTNTPTGAPVRTAQFAVTNGQLVRQTNFGTISGNANPRVLQLAAKIVF
jgi:hypothetical protein